MTNDLTLSDVEWDTVEGKPEVLHGLVFQAKAYKHGMTDIKGMWVLVKKLKAKGARERSVKYVTAIFASEAAARMGRREQERSEQDMTLAMLRGHAEGNKEDKGAKEDDDDGDDDDDDDDDVAEAAEGGEAPLSPKAAKSPAPASGKAAPAKPAPGSRTAAKKKAREEQEASEMRKVAGLARDVGLDPESVNLLATKCGLKTVAAFEALKGAGEAHAQELAVEAGLTSLQRIVLKKYMGVKVPLSFLDDVSKFGGDDADEDDEDAEEAAPPKSKGKVKGKYPLVGALLGDLPEEERTAAVRDALELVCLVIHKRAASAPELRLGAVALEPGLKAMGVTAAQLTPAPPGGLEEVLGKVLEITNAYAADAAPAQQGGRRVRTEVEEDPGVLSTTGRLDVAVLQAVNGAVSDKGIMKTIAAMTAMATKGQNEQVLELLSEACGNSDVATLACKGDALKPPAGAHATHAVQTLVQGLVRANQAVVVVVELKLRELLPGGANGRELAQLIVCGKLSEINFEKLFGLGDEKSSMGSLGGGAKASKRADATADPMLVFARGFGVLQAGYHLAHPFDKSVVQTMAELHSIVLRAVQQGVKVGEAYRIVVDPFLREMTRLWADVGRRAGMRPRMEEVRAGLAHNEKELRTLAAGAKPEPPAEEAAAELKRLKEENKALAKKVSTLERSGARETASREQGAKTRDAWEEENPGKCFFFTKYQNCTQGKACRHSSQEGHPQHAPKKA